MILRWKKISCAVYSRRTRGLRENLGVTCLKWLSWPCRPTSKFLFRLLSHNNINTLHLIVLKTFVLLCNSVFFFPPQKRTRTLSTKVTLTMTHRGPPSVDWLKMLVVFVTASCLCRWCSSAGQMGGGAPRMQQ